MLKSLKRDALLGDLLNSIDRAFEGDSGREIPPLGLWARKERIVLDGRPFDFDKHEYLIEPYADTHPYQVEIKATQLGLTSKALLRVVHSCRFGQYSGILYLFPSKTDVTEMSKGRLNPLIEDNPETIGSWIAETDSANVKKIWKSFLYLRGMQSRISLKSVPVDFIVFDELDEAPQENISMAKARMSHSEYGHMLFLSNPTMPDFGIDGLFSETDQQFWLLKCPRCNHYTDIVQSFMNDPDRTLPEVKGNVFRACEKCGGELNPSVGQWVAKKPQIQDKRGRQYSQLFSLSPAASPKNILHDFRTTRHLTNFYNLIIGVAYVEAQNRLSVQQVLNCCGQSANASSSESGTFMGVDQGDYLHVVIGKKHPVKAGELIHVGKYAAKEENQWKQLDELMSRFRVTRCVIDGMPETKRARAFAERFNGRVFLCFFNEHQKGSYQWNEASRIVQCNRTEAMDASHREIAEANIIFPKESDAMREFAAHCHHTAKKLEEDPDTGNQRYIYLPKVGGPDDYRLAFCYEAMARQSAPELLFPELL